MVWRGSLSFSQMFLFNINRISSLPHKLSFKSNTNARLSIRTFSSTLKKNNNNNQKKLNKGQKANLGFVVNIREVKSWQKQNETIPSLTHFPVILFLLACGTPISKFALRL